MTRAVDEWIGKTDDTAPPPRVKLRVFERCGGRCAFCRVKLGPGIPPEYDHIIALVNGGANRETNLQTLCKGCHKPKTARDVAAKAKDRRVRQKHLGITPRKKKMPYRRFDGTAVWGN